jgi:hypothetical protein
MELVIFPLCLIVALVIVHFVNVYCDWRDQVNASRPKNKRQQSPPLANANDHIDFGIFERFFGDHQRTEETQPHKPEIDCPHASPQCPKSCDGCKYAVIDV